MHTVAVKILIIVLVLLPFTLNSQNISGEKYYGLTREQLTQEAADLLKTEDGFEKFSNLGFVYHFLSEKGEAVAGDAVSYFEKALELKPDDYIIKAYLGSAYTLMANEAVKLPEIMQYVKKGTKILDEAYQAAPDDFELISIYVLNSVELSREMFDRTIEIATAIKNLESRFDTLTDEEKAGTLYFKALLATIRLRKKEAGTLYNRVIADYPDTDYASLAQQELSDKK